MIKLLFFKNYLNAIFSKQAIKHDTFLIRLFFKIKKNCINFKLECFNFN